MQTLNVRRQRLVDKGGHTCDRCGSTASWRIPSHLLSPGAIAKEEVWVLPIVLGVLGKRKTIS